MITIKFSPYFCQLTLKLRKNSIILITIEDN